ncbi:MAG: hypothetical protein GC204_12990 [Chloroflexi bacterium]|nr:hypothetical protein [Chloroflexota bacterium]
MRTDHVTAWLIKAWLQDNVPDLAKGWNLQVDPQILPFAAKIESIIPQVRMIFTCQNILAKTAIELWDLKEVALLAGGGPTPLSPRPDQVLYYSDGSLEVVEEARAAGYNVRHVNVTETGSLQQLVGAKSAIATGLFHFLPDEIARSTFAAVDQQGFQVFAFSHNTLGTDQDAMQQYENLGIRMFMRDLEDIQALLPPRWQIDFCEPIGDFVRYAGDVGAKLANTPHMVNFYKATKAI